MEEHKIEKKWVIMMPIRLLGIGIGFWIL